MSHSPQFTHPGYANDYVDLAKKLYKLLPYAKNRAGASTTLQQATGALERAMALFEQQNMLMVAFEAAIMFAALSNELAQNFGIVDYIETALETGEKVLLANIPPTTRNSLLLFALANNLANTCIFFAEYTDDLQDLQDYYEKGFIFVTHAQEVLDINKTILADSTILMMEKSFLGLSKQLHNKFVMAVVQQFAHADGAIRKRARLLGLTIYMRLHGAKTRDAVSFSNGPQIATERLEAATKEVEGILSLRDVEMQHVLIEKTLSAWFTELARELANILPIIGVNYHMSRILLALVRVVSGRLSITKFQASVLLDWLYSHILDKDWQTISPQELPYMARSEFIIAGIIFGIDSLLVLLEQIPSLREETRRNLRRRYAHLLHTVLCQNLSLQHANDKAQTAVDDLLSLLKSVPERARQEILDSYDEANLLT